MSFLVAGWSQVLSFSQPVIISNHPIQTHVGWFNTLGVKINVLAVKFVVMVIGVATESTPFILTGAEVAAGTVIVPAPSVIAEYDLIEMLGVSPKTQLAITVNWSPY